VDTSFDLSSKLTEQQHQRFVSQNAMRQRRKVNRNIRFISASVAIRLHFGRHHRSLINKCKPSSQILANPRLETENLCFSGVISGNKRVRFTFIGKESGTAIPWHGHLDRVFTGWKPVPPWKPVPLCSGQAVRLCSGQAWPCLQDVRYLMKSVRSLSGIHYLTSSRAGSPCYVV
jgi:hypothetical protein